MCRSRSKRTLSSMHMRMLMVYQVLTAVEHPFIVALRYSFQTEDHLCFCLDFIEGGNMCPPSPTPHTPLPSPHTPMLPSHTLPFPPLPPLRSSSPPSHIRASSRRYTDLMRGPYTHERAMFYAAQIVLATQHLHELDILYRDLKPDNVTRALAPLPLAHSCTPCTPLHPSHTLIHPLTPLHTHPPNPDPHP